MRVSVPFTAIAVALYAVASVADESNNMPAVNSAFAAWIAALEADDPDNTQKRADELVNFGEDAVHTLFSATVFNEDTDVCRESYRLLMKYFPDQELTREACAAGLRHADKLIRYECAFFLGEHRVYSSFRQLHARANDQNEDPWVRYAAAKSLAELGESEVIVLLYDGLGSDDYMPRYLSNRGIRALSGKDLNDFDYDYGEGVFVSGGMEMKMAGNAIEDSGRRAQRFATIEKFCRWLRDTHPDVYKHLDGGFFR